jgi:3-hydroxyisobutyrate dehydrogenase
VDSIGLIGLGIMGSAAAGKLVAAGKKLYVYDVSPNTLEKAAALGASFLPSPAEIAAACPLVLMFLPGPNEITQVVAGRDGLLSTAATGAVIVDHSTVDPGHTRKMASLAMEKSIGYLDAPVLGRPAAVGKWTLPVGGRPQDLEKCRHVLEIFAAKVLPIGPSGAGNKIKLLNQMMFSAINAMCAEMMAVADRLNVSPKLLYETITESQAGTVSNLFLELGRNISQDKYDNPTFSVDLLCKDVRLAIQMAKEAGAPPLLTGITQFLNETAQNQGFGRSDTSVMWKAVSRFWGDK